MNRSHRYAYQPDFWIFLVVGSIFLLIAASLFLNTLLFPAKAKSVPGTVIELVPNVGSDGYIPKVAFWEETRERRFEVSSSLGRSLTAYNEDERITVFYDPENPENAKIGDFTNLFAIPTILFFSGAFFFLCGFLMSKDKA